MQYVVLLRLHLSHHCQTFLFFTRPFFILKKSHDSQNVSIKYCKKKKTPIKTDHITIFFVITDQCLPPPCLVSPQWGPYIS